MPDGLDADLLERFVHGDQAAFESLFRQFERDVYRWIVRIVRDRAAADDVLVEAFWRAYRGRARFDVSRSFGAWMRRIATNAALDHLRAVRGQAGWRTADDSIPAPARQKEGLKEGLKEELNESIAAAFRRLPPKLHVVAMLALVDEQPYAEIADALNLPVGTIKSRVFRATRLLRKELARLGITP
jgi:RNA polymerase sigma-70 factor (ECF subfamily)